MTLTLSPQKSVKLKPVKMWAIKARRADHKTAMDYYKTRKDAEKDLATIPPSHGDFSTPRKYCDGNCNVGCHDDYEIVEVFVVQAPQPRVRKLKVKSL